MKPRVVVTGLGAITPIADNIPAFLSALKTGRSGIGRLSSIDTPELRVRIGAEIISAIPKSDDYDRVTALALIAAREAIANSGITEGEKVGVAWGTSSGGSLSFEQYLRDKILYPPLKTRIVHSATAAAIAIIFGAKGPVMTVSTACSSSANAIAYACELIRTGKADVVISGGSDTINLSTFLGFHALRLLDPECCRPFDKNRKGLVVGEGAGALILENFGYAKARGANIIAEVGGYGNASDAYHETKPDPEGSGAVLAMSRALGDAGSAPEQVNYINAHGTGTILNDRMETTAIKKLFRQRAYSIPVSSTKSMIGHLIGAAGAVEAITTILAIQHSFIPPTINYQTADPDCDLDYAPNHSRTAEVGTALSNSFAFGGNNVSLLIKRHG